jgi:hypothetical protein
MSILTTIRLVVFIIAIIFSLIVLSLSSHIVSFFARYLTSAEFNAIPQLHYAPMGIAVSVLTLLTLPTFVIIDNLQKGFVTSMIIVELINVTSMIIVELITLTLLWILWVTTASLTAQARAHAFFNAACIASSFGTDGSTTDSLIAGYLTVCQEAQAVEAFAFLAFFALLGYSFVLLVFTIIAHNRGHNVWTSSVKQTNFFAPPVNAPPDAGGEKGMPPQQQQQYQYPPQQNFAPPPQNFAPPPQQYGTPPPGAQYMPPPQQQQYPQYTGSPVPQNPPLPGHA